MQVCPYCGTVYQEYCPVCAGRIMDLLSGKAEKYMAQRFTRNGIWLIDAVYIVPVFRGVVGVVRDNRPAHGRVKRQGRAVTAWVFSQGDTEPVYIPDGNHIPDYVTRQVMAMATDLLEHYQK